MAALTIVIPDETNRKLAALAAREFRHPRDQAALLLVSAIDAAAASAGSAEMDGQIRASLATKARRRTA